jgi:uncharacterized repeat protein (TIGR03803 family)
MFERLRLCSHMLCLALCLLSGIAFAQTPDACSPIKPKPKNSNVKVPDVGKPRTPAGGVSNGWVLLYEDDSYQKISDEVFCRNNKIQFSSSDGENRFNKNPNCTSTTCTKVVEQGNQTQVVLTGKYGNTNTFLWKGDFPFFSVLHTFAGPPNDGANASLLIKDAAGNFYGATGQGGSANAGTVFKVDPSGKLTVLYSFTGGADGGNPDSGLARDSSGNLYGTTFYGGDVSCSGGVGCGVVFKLDASNVETVLHTFHGPPDGFEPGGVILDSSGNLYGGTYNGGPYCNCGIVYKLDTSNVETVLWNFTSGADGWVPSGPLLMDSSGNLYGTAAFGGSGGYGTVFKVDQSGNETTLFSFSGPPIDGCYPGGGVAMDGSGNLYGTTSDGCSGSTFGTVWKVSGSNEFLMHTFTGGGDGATPYGVILDALGNVYGTTSRGGVFNNGALFQVTPSGTETVLYDFSGSADGGGPGALLLDSEGYLWGAAGGGGSAGYGTLWGFDLK